MVDMIDGGPRPEPKKIQSLEDLASILLKEVRSVHDTLARAHGLVMRLNDRADKPTTVGHELDGRVAALENGLTTEITDRREHVKLTVESLAEGIHGLADRMRVVDEVLATETTDRQEHIRSIVESLADGLCSLTARVDIVERRSSRDSEVALDQLKERVVALEDQAAGRHAIIETRYRSSTDLLSDLVKRVNQQNMRIEDLEKMERMDRMKTSSSPSREVRIEYFIRKLVDDLSAGKPWNETIRKWMREAAGVPYKFWSNRPVVCLAPEHYDNLELREYFLEMGCAVFKNKKL